MSTWLHLPAPLYFYSIFAVPFIFLALVHWNPFKLRSPWLYSLICVPMTYYVPFVVSTSSLAAVVGLKSQGLGYAMRFLDLAKTPIKEIQSWTLYEFIFNMTMAKDPKTHYDIKPGSAVEKHPHFVGSPTYRRNGTYYRNLAIQFFLYYTLYNIGWLYLRTFGYDKNPAWMTWGNIWELHHFDWKDWKPIVDCYVLCVVGFFNIYNFQMMGCHIMAEVMNCTYFPLMNNPFISKTLTEFWSRRWNLLIKDNLHGVAFIPTLHLMNHYNVRSSMAKPAAAMAAFLLSCLMHEYLIYILSDYTATVSFENTVFFALHGVACIVQNALRFILFPQKHHKKTDDAVEDNNRRWDSLFRFGGILLTHLFFMWTAPLFMAPYIRHGIFERAMVFPTVI